MSRPDSADKDQLVDQLADQFETAWRAGERPKIESFLESAQASSRPRLLAELIKLEFELRQQAGEMPQVDEYRRRFPSLIAEVEEFFSQVDSSIMATTTIAAGTTPARGKLLIRLNCPHCQNPIQVVDDESREEVLCPSCGSSFLLDHDQTCSWKPEKLPTLGRYQLLEVIGRGAYGTVYRAKDSELDRVVAVKVPRTGHLVTRQEEDRFLREARTAAQLHHPSIVPVFEIGRDESVPYIVSHYVEGVTLADSLTAKKWELRSAAELIATLAEALDFAHQRGIIHRDVKPSNVIIDRKQRPYLMDFGLALRAAGEVTVTMDGQVLGTPAYMSPEQARGDAHRVDGRSDIYSLGVILYELLTGQRPFRGNTRILLQQVIYDEPRAPREINSKVPRDLENVCLTAIAKAPNQRYHSASEFAADLRRFLDGKPVLARRTLWSYLVSELRFRFGSWFPQQEIDESRERHSRRNNATEEWRPNWTALRTSGLIILAIVVLDMLLLATVISRTNSSSTWETPVFIIALLANGILVWLAVRTLAILGLSALLLFARKRFLRSAALVGMSVTIVCLLAFYLLFHPRRSSLVAVEVTDYDFPAPPNWSAIEELKDLSKSTITMIDGAGDPALDWNLRWQNVNDGLGRLGRLISRGAQVSSSNDVLIIYLNMLATAKADANHQMSAYLLHPGARADTVESLPVADVLRMLNAPDLTRKKKLFLVDVQCTDPDGNLANVEKTFSEALVEAFEDTRATDLVVLASARRSDIAWGSTERKGGPSRFSKSVNEALHGRADGFGKSGKPDGSITLAELADYVIHNRTNDAEMVVLPSNTTEVRDWWIAKAP